MGLLNFRKSKATPPPNDRSVGAYASHILDNDRDLSSPNIRDSFVNGRGMVYFGEDNLYPNAVNELYNISGIHSACVNFKRNTIVGGGYEWVNQNLSLSDQKKQKVFEIRSDFENLIDKVAIDYVKHGRAIVLLKVVNKEVVKAISVDPEKVRNDRSLLDMVKNSQNTMRKIRMNGKY